MTISKILSRLLLLKYFKTKFPCKYYKIFRTNFIFRQQKILKTTRFILRNCFVPFWGDIFNRNEVEIWNKRALELFSYPIPISCCLSQRGLAINLVLQNEPLFYNFENNYNYFIIYLLCNPDISHLITYSTLSGNCDSTSFFRRRSKKGLKTLCKRRIIKIVSSSFNSTFSPWKKYKSN